MYKLLLFLAIVFSLKANAQLDSINSQEDKDLCEDGKRAAIVNMKKGQFHVITYGQLPPTGNPDFLEFHKRYCLRTYGVTIGYGGRNSTPYYDCYTALMKDSVQAKYGDDFFVNVFEEAKMEFAISLQAELKTDKIWTSVDTLPSFPGGLPGLHEYFKSKMDLNFKSGGRSFFSFVVEVDGSLSDIKIMRGIDQRKDEELIQVLSKMPKWKPGILTNQKVRTMIYLPVVYGSEN